jgi:WD40 repeat protein
VFIWDFQKCTILDKLPTHSSSVNNIKFFQFSQKQENKSNK